MRIGVFGVIALGLLTAACGTTTTQRAASGAITGGLIGGICCGPVGLAAGVGAGAVGGWVIPEGADTLALNAITGEKRRVAAGAAAAPSAAPGVSGTSGMGPSAAAPSPQAIKQAQAQLQREGLYTGYIDGIAGPKTQQAVQIYQRQHGLPQTAQLDPQTLQSLTQTAQSGGAPPSGTSAPAQQPSGGGGGSTSTSTESGGNPPPSPPSPNR